MASLIVWDALVDRVAPTCKVCGMPLPLVWESHIIDPFGPDEDGVLQVNASACYGICCVEITFEL